MRFRTNMGYGVVAVCALAVLVPNQGFALAVGARDGITIIANTPLVDSFDSNDPAYSTNGLYSALQNKDRGNLVVQDSQGLVHTVHVGNGEVMGRIWTGPYGTVTIGPNGSVGSKSWVMTQKGIEPGWHVNNAGIFFPDVVLPATAWQLPGGVGTGGSGSVIVDGEPEIFDHVFSVSGDYWLTDNQSVYVGTNVSVRLYITATNFSPSKIYVAGTGSEAGRMVAYLLGDAVLRATHRTQSGRASGMVFFGLPTCLSVSVFSGPVTALVYAPGADVVIAGGGAEIVHFMGSIICRSFKASGHIGIHFDEDLFRMRSPIMLLFMATLENRNVLVGQTVIRWLEMIGDERLTYQWRLNGTNVPGATQFGWTITNAQPADAGWYDVVMTFSNLSGSITSPSGYLAVFETPAAVLHVPVAETNGLRIRVDGIEWYRYVTERSSNLVDWVRFRTNRGSFFDIVETNVTGAPQRFYRAVYEP